MTRYVLIDTDSPSEGYFTGKSYRFQDERYAICSDYLKDAMVYRKREYAEDACVYCNEHYCNVTLKVKDISAYWVLVDTNDPSKGYFTGDIHTAQGCDPIASCNIDLVCAKKYQYKKNAERACKIWNSKCSNVKLKVEEIT